MTNRLRHTHNLLLGVLICCLSANIFAASSAYELSNTVSRRFGLFIGERFTQQMSIAVPMSHSLERASLPKKGRANRWLELRDLDIDESNEGSERIYTLTLRYQVMTSDESVSLAALPRPMLRFITATQTSIADPGDVRAPAPTKDKHELTLRLAPQHISVSPISDIDAWDHAGMQALRPEHGTPLMDTKATKQRMVAYAAALSLLAAYWLYRVYGVPFWARSRGPFARAWRALRGVERGGADAASVQSAMRQLHCAFDATYGKTVFRDQIDAFLAQHPRYATQREPIERFFELSRRTFYANSASGDIALGDLRSLAHRLSLVERGLT